MKLDEGLRVEDDELGGIMTPEGIWWSNRWRSETWFLLELDMKEETSLDAERSLLSCSEEAILDWRRLLGKLPIF